MGVRASIELLSTCVVKNFTDERVLSITFLNQ